jgi:N-acetylmuramoyl-L-alanine amidase
VLHQRERAAGLDAGGAAEPRAGPRPSAAAAGKARAARTVIAIDPGHPSEVASGRGEQNGTNETRVAWEVALKLRARLEARGYEVVLTKSAEDELVRNRDRATVANRARAALMVRLHCDASVERGFAVYYPDRQGRTKDGRVGPPARVVEASGRAARAIHAGMKEVLEGRLEDNGVRTDFQTKVGREQGGALTGSIFSEVPVVTVEMVVLSDAGDAEFIKAEAGQQKMAEAIAGGVARFVGPRVQGMPRGKN